MRYVILVLLNLPLILIALLTMLTQYKMGRISKRRYYQQISIWLLLLIIIICSFPFYNYLNGHAVLDSHQLSAFDIAQTTAIIYLFYMINKQRQKSELSERRLRDMHQELSIKMSSE